MADRTNVTRVVTGMMLMALAASLLLSACATEETTERTRLPYIDEPAPSQPQVVTPVPPAQPGGTGAK